jgi:hypothetical protein
MSDHTGKRARLLAKRDRHVANLEATKDAIKAIDAKIADCDEKIAAEQPAEEAEAQ